MISNRPRSLGLTFFGQSHQQFVEKGHLDANGKRQHFPPTPADAPSMAGIHACMQLGEPQIHHSALAVRRRSHALTAAIYLMRIAAVSRITIRILRPIDALTALLVIGQQGQKAVKEIGEIGPSLQQTPWPTCQLARSRKFAACISMLVGLFAFETVLFSRSLRRTPGKGERWEFVPRNSDWAEWPRI